MRYGEAKVPERPMPFPSPRLVWFFEQSWPQSILDLDGRPNDGLGYLHVRMIAAFMLAPERPYVRLPWKVRCLQEGRCPNHASLPDAEQSRRPGLQKTLPG